MPTGERGSRSALVFFRSTSLPCGAAIFKINLVTSATAVVVVAVAVVAPSIVHAYRRRTLGFLATKAEEKSVCTRKREGRHACAREEEGRRKEEGGGGTNACAILGRVQGLHP